MKENLCKEERKSAQKRPLDKVGCKFEGTWPEWHEYADEMQKVHNEIVRNAQNFDALKDDMRTNLHKVVKVGRKAVGLCDLALDGKVDEGDQDDERKSRRTRDATSCGPSC